MADTILRKLSQRFQTRHGATDDAPVHFGLDKDFESASASPSQLVRNILAQMAEQLNRRRFGPAQPEVGGSVRPAPQLHLPTRTAASSKSKSGPTASKG